MHGVPALVDPLFTTHHITLSALRAPQFQQGIPVATEEKRHQKGAVENTEIRASMRTIKCSTVQNFILHIAEEEVLALDPDCTSPCVDLASPCQPVLQ
jgi:hypothetical protein